jgi:Uma2 family endonuclease
VIVEVLSDSTEAFDRGKKFEQYRSVASLEEYILVSQTEAHVEVYRRGEDAWTLREAGKGQRVAVAAISCEVDVDELYRGVFEERSA